MIDYFIDGLNVSQYQKHGGGEMSDVMLKFREELALATLKARIEYQKTLDAHTKPRTVGEILEYCKANGIHVPGWTD